MKRVLRVLKLMMVLMSLGGLSSCVNFCAKAEAEEEYEMIWSLRDHNPWVYDDGNVYLKLDFKDISENNSPFAWDQKRANLRVEIKTTYSNKKVGLSFTYTSLAGEMYSEYSSIKGHDIRTVLHMNGFGRSDIHIHYNSESDITFEFVDAVQKMNPVTHILLPTPIPFVEPVYHLKPSK